MKSYLADLRLLLEGCFGRLAGAFAYFAGSAAMDLVCMAILPAFVIFALAPDVQAQIALPGIPIIGDIPGGLFSVGVVGLFTLRAAFMLIVGSKMARVAESVRQRIVSRLAAEQLETRYESALSRSLSDEITAATQYSITFSQIVVQPLLRLALDLLTIIVVLAFVARLEPQIMLFASAVFVLVGLAYFAGIRSTVARQSRRMTELQADLHHQLTQAFSSPREVRVYGLQPYFARRIEENLRATARAQARLGAVYWFPRALGELTIVGLAVGYMLLKGAAGIETTLVVSNLSVIAFAGLRLLPAFAQGMANVSYLQTGRRVTRILAEKLKSAPAPARADGSLPVAPSEPFQSLELKQVAFRYEGAQSDALRDLSLTIRRGESAGVIGASGAGKSTLGDLLLGLLSPRQGEILINGKPVSSGDPAWWRLAGFVPQSPYIANDTLLRNIAYGVPDAKVDIGLVRRAVNLARLEEVVAALPNGLDTMLGDHGIRLSGGQRQRVAIARALYYQRDFLVLDEATSALDQDTEREVIGSIEALKGTITTFIIAHRLSTLQNCDFIIELHEGAVVDVRAPVLQV
jgi:ABC-type multidrug transport system fused ATPase/permease subunit